MELCDRCTHCTRVSGFEIQVETGTEIVDGLFCNNIQLLDIFYNTENGKRKSKKDQVSELTPLLIGKVCWICKGNYFNDRGKSIFE